MHLSGRFRASAKLLILLGILLQLPTARPALATDLDCVEALTRRSWSQTYSSSQKFTPGVTYYVILENENVIRELKFEHQEGEHLIFTRLANQSQGSVKMRVRPHKVKGFTVATYDRGKTRRTIKDWVRNKQKHIALTYFPYKLLDHSHPDLKVVGTLQSTKKTGKEVANALHDFDTAIKAMGFQTERIRVVVSESAILPDPIGPFYSKSGYVNLWNRNSPLASDSLISAGKNGIVLNQFVLSHERMHSVLHTTYNEVAYVNQNSTIQEALADFAAAHVTNRPRFSLNLRGARLGRDIAWSRAFVNNQVIEINTPLDFRPGSYHHNSLLFSNFLWQVRGLIGRDEMDHLFERFVYALNLYRPAFETRLTHSFKRIDVEAIDFSTDLEYVLAVMVRVATDSGEFLSEPSREKLSSWMPGFVTSKHYSFPEIARQANQLVKTPGHDFTSQDLWNFADLPLLSE